MRQGNGTVIIKRVKKGGHGHHGGAWKIAYADFVTAMMAFFLLLWLVSMTTPEQKEGLANYFAPPNVSPSTSGSGGILGGQAMDSEGAQTRTPDEMRTMGGGLTDEAIREGLQADMDGDESSEEAARQALQFHSAAASIRQAWQSMPEIAEMADTLIIEQTEDGLDIQIVEQQGRPMFQEGSRYPYEWMRSAISAIAPALQRLPNQVRISGHTAAGKQYADPRYGAWELSSDRANVVRGLLGEFGLTEDRVHSVVGRATTEPYFVNDPYLAANERIRVTVLNAPPPLPADMRL